MFLAFHGQNWLNALLLGASLFFSFFGSLINNRFSGQRTHNLTKLFNEGLSKANLAFVPFYATLAIFRANSEVGRGVMWFMTAFSAVAWIISLFVTEHVLDSRLPHMHNCELIEGQMTCKITPSYGDIRKVSNPNLLIFLVLLIFALIASFNFWTCGITCVEIGVMDAPIS